MIPLFMGLLSWIGAASGAFSVGSHLALPAPAGVAIAAGGIEVDGFLTRVMPITLGSAGARYINEVAVGVT
jgi:hypothetical protein